MDQTKTAIGIERNPSRRKQVPLDELPPIKLGEPAPAQPRAPEVEPDWSGRCEVCDASPIVPVTGMCGPCTFGEAATAGGNW